MAVYNFGSINIDHFYRVPHLVRPGETLAATGFDMGLGGKGANQSVAAALAGSTVFHIGTVGYDGQWARQRLTGFGVETGHIATADMATGHAIIMVDDDGENAIIIYPGANEKQSLTHLKNAISQVVSGDIVMLQNETTLTVEAASLARGQGAFVVYSAAPFDAYTVSSMLPHIDLLVVNQIEADALSRALGTINVPNILITRGADGATWRKAGGDLSGPAFSVNPVDTTGAGDCFTGYVVAGLDCGMEHAEAMRRAAAAAAIKVTRPGTADAMPNRQEVEAFLAERQAE